MINIPGKLNLSPRLPGGLIYYSSLLQSISLNPARLLGIDDQVGSIEVGKKANLIIIDDMVHIQKVILEGDLMVENGELIRN